VGYPFQCRVGGGALKTREGNVMSDASMATITESNAGFRIGDVLGRSFSILKRNFVPFTVLSGIAMLPYAYIFLTQANMALALKTGVAPSPPKFGIAFGLTALLAGLMYFIAQAVIIFGAFQDMRGQRVSIGASLRVGLNRFFPFIGLAFCEGFCIVLGMMLLIVPGVILFVAWSVAISVCVVEKLGPVKSLGRSAQLTKGHRWKIFGILLLVMLGSGLVGAILNLLLAAIGNIAVFVILHYIWQALYTAFFSILMVVIYRDLRVAKDGIDTDRIAAVFD
jgi:MFS family permease